MRIFDSIFLLLLLGLSSPVPVRAETTVYFLGHSWEVPPSLMLIVGGLALIAVGSLIRRSFERAQEPESEPDDVNVTGPLPESPAMIDLHVADGEHADKDRPQIPRPAA